MGYYGELQSGEYYRTQSGEFQYGDTEKTKTSTKMVDPDDIFTKPLQAHIDTFNSGKKEGYNKVYQMLEKKRDFLKEVGQSPMVHIEEIMFLVDFMKGEV